MQPKFTGVFFEFTTFRYYQKTGDWPSDYIEPPNLHFVREKPLQHLVRATPRSSCSAMGDVFM